MFAYRSSADSSSSRMSSISLIVSFTDSSARFSSVVSSRLSFSCSCSDSTVSSAPLYVRLLDAFGLFPLRRFAQGLPDLFPLFFELAGILDVLPFECGRGHRPVVDIPDRKSVV